MVQIDQILFSCSLVGHLDSFHFLAILNHVAVHVHMQVFLSGCTFMFILNIHLEVELLGSMAYF